MPKFLTMDEEAEQLGVPPLTEREMQGMLADNYLRFISR